MAATRARATVLITSSSMAIAGNPQTDLAR
jgi:hypothetical protein